ncbi:Bug family tripartite tricarboxylate transporter substrate binding protein [Bradyrhizobium cenepequi]|uniref:Bug family tripartite tricarboxylate transporter substrate binding protein n=1 Tax=Bradyrhizobium cenepequi TaxID=2821403 RepID=UPI001CE3376B|nr:tripartite tricarboxylate transporter substrate binding protein [Bradyrhizobium cenepequi]MCA6110386.1 tripartite tricarboxylate transporter substrate binding protein [Bradyrhizobium cenepequi]
MQERKYQHRSRREILRAGGTFVGLVAGASFRPGPASAGSYPDRPIKIIVPFAPGGPTDIIARILATHLGQAIGGTAVVENRPGAGGNIGIGIAAHAVADGYTLLVTSSAYVVNPGLYAKIPYDPYKDFAPIAELGTSPNVILVAPGLGVNSVADLVSRAKANPNELNYASPGIGTTPHLSGEIFKIVGEVNLTHVPFSGAGPAIQAILAGTTQVAFAALPPAHPHIKSGALKALAVTGARRWFDLPDVPTMVELGYKDFISDTFQGFLAPAKTPAAIIELLSAKSIGILKTPEIAGRLRNDGFEVIANGPDGMRKRIDDEVPK